MNKSVWFTTESINQGFTQTVYDVVTERGIQVGHGEKWNDSNMKVIDNLICYHDKEFGYLPVVALGLDQVNCTRDGNKYKFNIYGSVIEINYPNGESRKAICLDAIGQGRYEKKIDLYQYKLNIKDHVENISFRFIRKGFDYTDSFKF